MWGYVSIFSAPKRGSKISECEDVAWVSPTGDRIGDISERSLRIVVADGASESLLAGKWARLLTSTFGTTSEATRSRPGFLGAYKAAVEQWESELDQYINERERRGAPIQWFEEPGLAKGAFSTVVALDVTRPSAEKRGWRATALGDSCVFQVREDRIQSSFPVTELSEFSNRPALLPSRPVVDDEVLLRNVNTSRGDWEPGDTFYVATDALAAWFLKSSCDGQRPWDPLRDLGTVDGMEFSAWVDMQRDLGELHDDDTTLVRVDLY